MRTPDDFDAAAAKVAGQLSTDPIDAAARQVVDGQRAQAKTSLYNALLQNPDMAARAQKLGRQTGIPADVVQRNLPEVERNAFLSDFDRILQNSPTVAQWVADPNNAAVSHDDVGVLGSIESALRYVVSAPNAPRGGLMSDLGTVGMAGVSGLQRASAGVVGLAQAPFELAAPLADPLVGRILPGNPLRATAEGLSAWRQNIEAQAKANTPKAEGVVGAGVISGVQSLATNIAALPMIFAGPAGQRAYMTQMTAPVFGQSYGEARDKNVAPLQALSFGVSQATIEYATEKLPMAKLIGDLKVGAPLYKVVANQLATEIPGEQLATILQDLNEWAVLNPDKPFRDYLAERPNAAAQTLIATVVGVGGQISVVKGIEAMVGSLADPRGVEQGGPAAASSATIQTIMEGALQMRLKGAQAEMAERDAQAVQQLTELVKQSKLAQRDPATFQEFVRQAAQDGPVQDVYVNAQTFAQMAQEAGITEQQLPEGVRTQLPEALATGGDLRIPIEEFAAQIAPTQYAQALLDHVKTDPLGMSRAEAQVYMQTQIEELRQQVEQSLAEREQDVQFKTQIDQVRTEFKQQLDDAKRFTPDVNDQYANLLANFYAVTAAKVGTTPAELVKRYPLRVQAEGVAPDVAVATFDQGDVQPTDQVDESTGLPLNSDGTVTLFHHTSADKAAAIKASGELRSAGEPDVYLTTREETDTGYGDTAVRVRIDPAKLVLDDEFPDGRQDFRVSVGRPGGSLRDATFFQFAGQKAQTADMYALVNAEERLAKGEPAERVRRETGWFQGVDGMWRFEIADNEAKFNAKDVVTVEELSAEIGDQIQVGVDPNNATLFKATFGEGAQYKGAFGRSEAEAEINLLRAIAKDRNVGVFDIAKVKANDEFFLSDVLDHPKLFAAYPDLADTLVKFVEGVDYRGLYSPRGDRIEIAISGDQEQMLSTLLHEVQHAIQQREGFAQGGAPAGDFTKAVKDALSQLTDIQRTVVDGWKFNNQDKLDAAAQAAQVARYGLMWESAQRLIDYSNRDKPSGVFRLIRNEMQWIYSDDMRSVAEAQELQRAFYGIPRSGVKRNQVIGDMAFRAARLLLDTIPKDLQQQFKDDPRTMKGMIAALQRQSEKARKALAPLQKLERKARAAKNVLEAHRYSTPFEVYQALAGEIEARNTQARQQMTEEERQATSPAATADVPAERTIVMFGGLDIQAPMAAFSQDPTVMQQGTGNRGQIAFGQDITQVPSIITLLKGADLSTFLHESGHFFLEVQFDLASRIGGENAMFGAESATPGEQTIMRDTQALLDWFGVQTIDEWFNLPMEQKRSYHEQFARGFEAYLFEGKAPSIELQGMFQRFRAWLLRVYKDLKALKVELTDEVRGVMDRMLATTEQIDLAEKGRSMLPLFTAPEQAGMTTEEFAAYQELGTQATQDAIEDLQARTLRDMAYMRNARGREVKRLQKEAAARRAEMTIEARREIMSQPVYRAWQFLTGKLDANDKAMMAPEPERKSRPGPVDPEVDSLFVAIAKLGGLDRKAVESQWGWDPKERSPMPIFGKYLLRREDGLSLDAMGEQLAEYGYLPKDENGKFDQRDLEDKFDAEYRGDPQYSYAKDYTEAQGERRPGEDADIENMGAGRLDAFALKNMGLPEEIVQIMENLKMTAKDGIHPDLVAESFGFTSGDELVRTLAIAEAPKVAIEGLTDQKMLEKYGELATPEAIERAADQAIHNDTRARFVATELNALAKATGKPKVLASAAREYARSMIDRLLVRNVKPAQYAAAEVRAAKASEKAMKGGDTAQAAAEKRNQLINTYATRAAHDALTEVEKGLRYLKKFEGEGTRKSIDVDYLDQIDAILERFDLRAGVSLKAIEKRKALAKWIGEQEELGIEVELPEKIAAEAFRQSYKDLTIEEFRGLVDSIKQIEHLGRLKEKLLTAADNRRFADVVREITMSIEEHAGDKRANNRTRDTAMNRAVNLFKGFLASHRKTASLARELDGFQDAGPMWTYLIRSMNEAGDQEATMRADATRRLTELLKPVLAEGRMGGKGQFFPSIAESLNRGEQLVLALNMGNAGNQQRLLDGRGWTFEQVVPVLQNLSAADWQFVQQVWDFFESYRPQIAAKERRVMGKEPAWVEPLPLVVETKDGATLNLRGGYFPIVYDSRESGRAEQQADAEAARQQMKGAFVAATTRRSFTKTRAEQVTGRPLVLTWDALFRGVNDVIHDLSWHEWVIDANRIIKNEQVDKAIRSTYGADVVQQFKTAIRDIAAGDAPNHDALSRVLTPLRTGAAVAGLGFNLMNAAIQPLGLTQSMVRVGTRWVAMGVAEWAKSPVGLVRQVHEKSEFMRNRARTQQRELNEIQSVVQGKSAARQKLDALMFMPMQSLQLVADMPTWWGAYQKALAEAPVDMAEDVAEDRAIKLADQAVLDAQSGGQVKDLALVQRGGPMQKLFTVFYGYFSAAYNLGVERAKSTNYRDPLEVMHLAWDFLLLYSVPAVLAALIKDVLQPGGDDEDELAKKLIGEQISYLMGLLVGVREITGAVQYATGTKQFDMAYGGPAGLRFFQELDKLGKQVGQGELDRALARSVVNVGGVLLHLPSGQINRTIDGVIAISEGQTDNPAALLFGVQK